MGKRRHELSATNESVEESVLKKYHNYKKRHNITDSTDNEEVVDDRQVVDTTDKVVVNESITETDDICADRIIKDVKKIKDKATKEAIKLRKKAKKLAKKAAAGEKLNETTGDNKIGNKTVDALWYLNDWKYRPSEWKFKKNYQIWLMKHWTDAHKLNDKHFELFVEYIFAAKSGSLARTRLESEAKDLIDKQSTAEPVDDKVATETTATDVASDDTAVDRARRILQCVI